MGREEAFIERILDARWRSAEARESEEAAIAEAAAAMGEAVGTLAAFAAMDSHAFPVSTEAVGSLDDASEVRDFGALVTAIVDSAASCTRVYVEARTLDADEYMTLSLHPARSGLCWTLEASTRGHDGTDWTGRREYKSAEKALAAVRTRLLGTAVRIASRGEMDSLPVLPEGDAAAARIAREQVAAALEAGRAADARRKRHAEEIARSGNTIMAAWDASATRLRFLERVGYALGKVKGGLGIVPERTRAGLAIRIVSGESWARLSVEALDEDPAVASLVAEDSAGRRESRGQVAVADAKLLASEIEGAVLAEIEAAETAYLPEQALTQAAAPTMQ